MESKTKAESRRSKRNKLAKKAASIIAIIGVLFTIVNVVYNLTNDKDSPAKGDRAKIEDKSISCTVNGNDNDDNCQMLLRPEPMTSKAVSADVGALAKFRQSDQIIELFDLKSDSRAVAG